jgi:hypothetical protein
MENEVLKVIYGEKVWHLLTRSKCNCEACNRELEANQDD